MIEACIFDLDGVIVDTAKYHFLAWKRLADFLDIPFSEEDNEKMKGISRVASLEKLLTLGNKKFNESDKTKFCHCKNEWYLQYVNEMTRDEILPGVIPFMEHLRLNNVKTALGSASKNARHILELTHLTDDFDAIVDGNDVVKSKPDPEVFTKGANLLCTAAAHTVVFEDSAKGIDAAISGGFLTVGIGLEEHLGHANIVIQTFEGLTLNFLKTHLN